MNELHRTFLFRLCVLTALIVPLAGCFPAKYISSSGKELILASDRSGQTGEIDQGAAKRCLEGETAVYKKLFGDRHNPCAELGLFLINNTLVDEGVAYFEKGLNVENSYNASVAAIQSENLGVMQKTRVANLLFDICLTKQVKDLIDGRDITADICTQAGALFEKVKYRENAILMYRKKCELTGKCDELTRLGAPVKK
ncbi:hypothetical protein OR1_00230 [Geobacter sp. OR-1]|uniref:hypothetical protein n=1 Tax=Geobacter sp. OR-1 TaxID=1266765 RepID=UPI000541FF99|nr:hypothetical protein [Geobacter sp. OR-1]GAM07961.1 hypothetical protein OR1_00230 [Geobacter sp. OR-1]